jgi:hypothetical protein
MTIGAKVALPRLTSTPTLSFTVFATTRSSRPSPSRSTAATDEGSCPTRYTTGAAKVPSPTPSRVATLDGSLAEIRSSLPSPFRSAVVTNRGAPLPDQIAGLGTPNIPAHPGPTQAPAMQVAPPLQRMGSPPTQAPFWHVSVWVHISPSSQAVPFGRGGWIARLL